MAQTNSGNYDALVWVQDDIQQSLADALTAVTRFIDSPDDTSKLVPCINQLGQTHGVIDMLGLAGANLLIREMLSSISMLTKQTSTNSESIADTILKGLLLLPNYLKLIGHDFEDHPLRLIETINELRTARGEAPLSPTNLFKPNFSIVLPNDIALPSQQESATGLSLDKASHAFQISLLQWIKTQDRIGLKKISQIVHYLRTQSTHDRLVILWWVAEGFIEALLDDGLPINSETKLTLGNLNHSIKLFGQNDIQQLMAKYPTDLVKNLLLFIARSSSSGKHVSLLKHVFKLDFYDVQKHQKLYSFSDNALTEVHSALLEQLQEIKAQIDQFDRHTVDSQQTAAVLSDSFNTIADTLDLLSESTASNILRQQAQQLAAIHDNETLLSDEQLLSLADDVLTVENLLRKDSNNTGDNGNETAQLQPIVINECLTELFTIKEALTQLETHLDTAHETLPEVAIQMELIAGSLTMLNLTEVASLLENTATRMREPQTVTRDVLSIFAEVIAAIELYMGGVTKHGQQQLHLLQQAQNKLDQPTPTITKTTLSEIEDKQTRPVEEYITKQNQDIDQQFNISETHNLNVDKAPFDVSTAYTSISLDQEALALTLGHNDSDVNSVAPSEPQLTGVQRYIDAVENQQHTLTLEPVENESIELKTELTPSFAQGIDPEIAEIFIEEANEVLGELATLIPEWQTRHDADVLAVIRRHFHTLKGSGRMAGADVIGQLAWSIESLLNQVIEKNSTISTDIVQLVLDGFEIIPDLLTRFIHADISSTIEVDTISARANALLNPEQASAINNAVQDIALDQRVAQPVLEIDDTPLDLTLEAVEPEPELAPVSEPQPTSVQRYIDALATKQDNVDLAFDSTEQQPLERDDTALDLPFEPIELESELTPVSEPQPTSVQRYIDTLATKQDHIELTFDNNIDVTEQNVETDEPSSEASETTLLQELASISETLELDHDFSEPELTDSFEATATEMSEHDELLQIFHAEAQQHLATFKHAFEHAHIPFVLNKELLRAAHSLKGCANIAQVTPVALIATELDHALRTIYEHDHRLNSDEFLLLQHTIEAIYQIIEHQNNPEIEEPNLCVLSDNLFKITPRQNKVEPIIDPEFLVVYLEETDELLEQYSQQLANYRTDPSNQAYKQSVNDTLIQLADGSRNAKLTTIAKLYELLGQIITHTNSSDNQHGFKLLEQGFEHINDQIDRVIQNQAATDIGTFQSDVEQYIALPASPMVAPDGTAATLFAIPTGEEELLEAFTEECAELLESSGDAIKNWQHAPNDVDAAMQLQRDLHTLKGGARLTGITPIADLSHQTESLVLLAVEHKCEANDRFFNLLQRCQDRMADMQDLLAQQASIAFADDLLAEIAAFSGQEPELSEPQAALPSDIVNDYVTKLPNTAPVDAPATPQQPAHVEQVRVRSDLLDFLTNFAGEVNISRDRVSQHNTAIRQQLSEMEATVERLQDQLRNLEIETETQILFRYEGELTRQSEFDPLELDRFSMIQQLSRGLTESVSDLNDITQSLNSLVRDSDAILLQQSRLSTDIQQGLMNTRLLPFSGLIPRLERIVRQTNESLGKSSKLTVYGAERELDRSILDHIVAPIEHILRNAIGHGIEAPEQRMRSGKDRTGQLDLTITRDGTEILITLADDGRGIDVEKIKQKALSQNLINPDNIPGDDELIQLILSSGFTTADDVSQLSGRGVGMDVVSNEIRALKGRLSIQSIFGQGTTFSIRLPLTLSIMQALLVSSYDHQYAIPLAAVHAGERITVANVKTLLAQEGEPRYEFNGAYYQFIALAQLLDQPFNLADDANKQLPLLLFRYSDKHIALLVDAINSNREIVLKSVGPQLGQIDAITGATIMGDGQVAFVLDIPTLIEKSTILDHGNDAKRKNAFNIEPKQAEKRTPIAMVVDDSITMRKATGNLLKRHGFDVITARDGIDAVALINEQIPDIILLDVEMPRMDGFEFASVVRNNPETKSLPIIMITSRTGDKHRERASTIGVNAYLGKPYQENELVQTLQDLLGDLYPNTLN
ncbi:MAG: Hpt domain-containing protein [Gammaproteobacteria bacterium]|nr:Hpt domain-containing protein [Gammaproteobacteria bacterium]